MPRYDEPTEQIGPPGAAATEVVPTGLLAAGSRLGGGRYELDRVLGRGGMAAVWLAHDRRLERPVAIKVLSDILAGDRAYLARFEREATVAAGLAHPNLVRIYDYGVERERPFLIMEYVDGGDLAVRLEVDRSPDPDQLARELLGALRHIHGAGVLHRDVKAQNVLIGRDGGARLTDFGIAQPSDSTSLTQTGVVLGTGRYLAPEVLEGGVSSVRSDLYSLGVLLGDVAAARAGSRRLATLIDSLRAHDPRARPASAAAALDELERPAGRQHAVPDLRVAPRRTGAERPRGRLTRRLAAAGAAAALIVVLAIATVVAGGGGDGGEGSQPGDQVAASGSAADEQAGGGEGEPEAGDEQPIAADGKPNAADADADADGFELNDRGFAMINEGRPREAVPVLRRAVDALEGSGEITYAYALFNLGRALRLSGEPDQAVPILEARLQIPNQRGVVRRELEAARAAARP